MGSIADDIATAKANFRPAKQAAKLSVSDAKSALLKDFLFLAVLF